MSNLIQDAILSKVGVPKFRNYLNLTSLRHKLTAGNVANVLTPGYDAKDIDFQKEFQRLKGESSGVKGFTTNPRHIPLGMNDKSGARIVIDKKAPSNGVNKVNIDKEMTKLSTNQISYTVAARMLKNKFNGLRQAITGSK
jgi:flagellar basal-body rod protein FlgB